MSRSYKKHPYCGDYKNRFMKNYSNRMIRRKLKNPNFEIQKNEYRKIMDSWDICDYWWYEPWETFWNQTVKHWYMFHQYNGESYPDEKETYKKWFKWNKRK